MNIKSIRLRNFRGFRDTRIELKPLTVLLGPNSAGKSSFGHALAAMAHAHRLYAAGPQATLTPAVNDAENWPIDLGVTSDLRTAGAEGPIRIELETRGGLLELGFGGLDKYTPDLLISHVVHPTGEQSAPAETPEKRAIVISTNTSSSAVPLDGADRI